MKSDKSSTTAVTCQFLHRMTYLACFLSGSTRTKSVKEDMLAVSLFKGILHRKSDQFNILFPFVGVF